MAINFDEIKEQVGASLKNSWEQFQESAVYNQLNDRFENLSASGQKIAIAAILIFVFLMIFSFPWGYYSKSNDFITEFEDKRSLIRDLLKVSREKESTPQISIPPPMDAIKSRIESMIQQSQFIPEQVRGIEQLTESSQLIPTQIIEGVFKVTLSKLNLRQVIDFGFQLQSQSASIKMKDVYVTTNGQDPQYLDVTYKLLVLKVPQFEMPEPEPEEPPKGANRRNNNKNN